MFKISKRVINFIPKAIEKGKMELVVGVQILAEVKIQKGNFQGNSLSLLLFFGGQYCRPVIYLENPQGREATNLQNYKKRLSTFCMSTISIYFPKIKKNWGRWYCSILTSDPAKHAIPKTPEVDIPLAWASLADNMGQG